MKNNLDQIRAAMQNAINNSHRDEKDVTLIAVSKTQSIDRIMEAYELGCRHFGENKVQEIQQKYDLLPKDAVFHMIGHLQKNKVKYIIDKVAMIHSVDSYELASVIQKEAAKKNVIMPVLIEVNVAGEESKFGVAPKDAEVLIREISLLTNVEVRGLMTIAPYVDNPEDNRTHFTKLRELLVDITQKNIDNVTMSELSMGMTGDYCVAIEEGATIIRVGTGIFGDRNLH